MLTDVETDMYTDFLLQTKCLCPNLFAATLTPSVMTLGWYRRWGHLEVIRLGVWSPHEWIKCPSKKRPGASCLAVPAFHHVRIQVRQAICTPGSWPSLELCTFILDFSDSRTGRNKCLFSNPPLSDVLL